MLESSTHARLALDVDALDHLADSLNLFLYMVLIAHPMLGQIPMLDQHGAGPAVQLTHKQWQANARLRVISWSL